MMIKQKIITDAMQKIVLGQTIKAVTSNVLDDDGNDITTKLSNRLKADIKLALSKALINHIENINMARPSTFSQDWIPHYTKKGETKKDILKVPVEIENVPNVTVGNLIHAHVNIEKKLNSFIDKFEKPAPKIKTSVAQESFPEKVGVLRWKSANNRRKVYDYWKDISKIFKELESQTKKWAEKLKGTNDKKNLTESLNDLENYVIEMNDVQQMPVGTHLDIFEDILNELQSALTTKQKDASKNPNLDEEYVRRVAEMSTKTITSKIERAADEMDDVDPLLAASISNGLTKLGYSKKTLETQKNRLLRESKKLDIGESKIFEKKLDELITEAEAINPPFYLPDTEFTSIDGFDWLSHEKYLKTIHDILFKEGSRREMGRPRDVGGEMTGRDIYVESRPSSQSSKPIPPVLLNTIKKYYSPLSRTNTNFMGNPPKFMESSTWDDIMSLDDDPTLDFDKTLISPKQMEALADFIGMFRRGAEEKYDDATKDLAYRVFGVLDELFKGKHRKANQETIGWFLNKNNPPTGERFMGESIEKLAKRYDQQKEPVYPLLDMEGLINSPKFINLFDPDNTPTRGLEGVTANLRKNLFDQVKKLNENYKKLAKKKKDVHSQILETHDVIRKSYGKPIHYGMNDLGDIEDANYVLKRLSSQGYDLTAIELTAMVESISSFDRIAKSFGVNEETVYLAKGLCR
tara:strand:+ start:1458 stop:3533 length:2076 start_codon:yes stop_codon:yes gene_type:complete